MKNKNDEGSIFYKFVNNVMFALYIECFFVIFSRRVFQNPKTTLCGFWYGNITNIQIADPRG